MTDMLFLFLTILIFPGFLFVLAYALVFEYVDRLVLARMQHRIGPPWYQPFADLVKLLAKEVIDPAGVDRPVFNAGPLFALAAVLTAFIYVPVTGMSPLAFEGDLVLVLYLLSAPAIILFVIGWLSRNVYAAIGGVRAVTQLFIYEVPFFLALLTPALMAGSWSVSAIAAWQQQHLWFAVFQPIGFIVALVGLQAKLERAPFDIPEAETEIVAGPWTELTGRRLAVMHLAMDVSLVTGSALIAAVYLGGPFVPWVAIPSWSAGLAGFVAFCAKTIAILLVLSTVRAATGRIRIDQLNEIGWKYIAGAAILQVAVVLVLQSARVVP